MFDEDVKKCEHCQCLFERTEGWSRKEWAKRKFCTKSCSASATGGKKKIISEAKPVSKLRLRVVDKDPLVISIEGLKNTNPTVESSSQTVPDTKKRPSRLLPGWADNFVSTKEPTRWTTSRRRGGKINS